MDSLDIVPSYIKIFDKYDNCRRFLLNSVGKPFMEINGYYAVSVLCFDKAMAKHEEIRNNLNVEIIKFFKGLKARIGSEKNILEAAEKYYTI